MGGGRELLSRNNIDFPKLLDLILQSLLMYRASSNLGAIYGHSCKLFIEAVYVSMGPPVNTHRTDISAFHIVHLPTHTNKANEQA